MVDMIITGAPGREQMARALRRFAGLPADLTLRAQPPITAQAAE
jgi:hypothetical protein